MIEEAIYQIGITHVGLRSLIGGAAPNTRIYPSAEERKHALPVVVFAKEGAEPVAGIYLDSGWYHTTFAFAARAATPDEAKAVIEQVRLAYQRYHSNGAVVAGTNHKIDDVEAFGSAVEYYDPDLDCYVEEIELVFFHN